ncbi:hypothetical protein SAMN04487769_0123 [Burkholderia sp. b14]|uniref:hypothetical protein n=1 Tax=Mycetohabitans sp. B7 TaxID=2841844 RepID=UPI00096709FB|nr:hypothetical protein [Mycetohabitans sp. B7]MCG1039402.1 hypothetical protein [Mycetohabitans sp. B7]SIT64906.1 hypothetical protein SAMN04487769_0123 [Burkholderia sp. b14]
MNIPSLGGCPPEYRRLHFSRAMLFPFSRLCVFCAPSFSNMAALMRAKAGQGPLNLPLSSPVLERVTPLFEQPA